VIQAAAWRVAALATMNKVALRTALSGDKAGEWVGAAAALGLADAQVRLGRMRLEGEGVARDPHGAFQAFTDAAAQDHVDGHNMLGRCHENGWGTEINYPLAAQHYRIAAEKGLDWAQYNLAHMLLSGVGVAQDREQAFHWYNQAANQGHVRAMNLVGRCHEEGWATPKDLVAAQGWYRRSAEGGYFRGAYNYATMLAQTGCAAGARMWIDRAIATAPEPTRQTMIALRQRQSRG
jgi:uncharacterized protein